LFAGTLMTIAVARQFMAALDDAVHQLSSARDQQGEERCLGVKVSSSSGSGHSARPALPPPTRCEHWGASAPPEVVFHVDRKRIHWTCRFPASSNIIHGPARDRSNSDLVGLAARRSTSCCSSATWH
jgi:hypothetical protein